MGSAPNIPLHRNSFFFLASLGLAGPSTLSIFWTAFSRCRTRTRTGPAFRWSRCMPVTTGFSESFSGTSAIACWVFSVRRRMATTMKSSWVMRLRILGSCLMAPGLMTRTVVMGLGPDWWDENNIIFCSLFYVTKDLIIVSLHSHTHQPWNVTNRRGGNRNIPKFHIHVHYYRQIFAKIWKHGKITRGGIQIRT